MAQSCWYKRSELSHVSQTGIRPLSPSSVKMNTSKRHILTPGIRQRSKSTSSETIEENNVVYRRHNVTNGTVLEGDVKWGQSIGFSNNISSGNNGGHPVVLNNSAGNCDTGISSSTGNLLAGERELVIGERIRSRARTISGGLRRRQSQDSKCDKRFSEAVNVGILTCVFVLGAVSAVFVVVCYKNGEFSMGPLFQGYKKRSETFQPFPSEDHLAVIDENYLNPIPPPDSQEDNECDGENKLALELEAISSVRTALVKKSEGKLAKAQKLFQHAIALCPRHPDVLTHYGEFYEDTRQDFMMADHLYVQALTYSPHHSKALTNRKRTLPVVEELDEKRLKRIDSKLDQLLQLSETNRALRRIRKEAYFQHIYHSAGIEGNTMTLSQTRLIVETRMAVGGKSIIEHNEILGLDAAMRFMNTTLVNRIGKITVQDILQIHKHLMGFVDPAEAGHFRRTQVFVGNHIPPNPEEIPEQMTQLVEWLNSEEALSLHPIHYAAIAHYKLVYVHPFLDGNGRTSRLLMNWVLMQANYPPVIIRKQDRLFYYDHLSTANKGDLRPFIRFIGDCTEKTMDVYLWATQERNILELEDDHSIDHDNEP